MQQKKWKIRKSNEIDFRKVYKIYSEYNHYEKKNPKLYKSMDEPLITKCMFRWDLADIKMEKVTGPN